MICTKCLLHKPELDFHFRNRLQNLRHQICAECQRTYSRKYYKDNKEVCHKRTTATNKSRRLKNSEVIRNLKNVPCIDCNQKYPYYVMDFDHKSDKKFNISRAITAGLSIENILTEISKCEVVCANCHRIRTFKNKL